MLIICQLKSKLHLSSVISFCTYVCPEEKRPENTFPLYFSIFFKILVISMFFQYKTNHQFSSVAQLCPTLCDPINRSTPGLPFHHQLPEFTQTHVHRVSDATQPSHPLSSPSPPAPSPSQHQGLFQWVNSLHEVAKVLSFSFSISPSNEHPGLVSFRMDWLDLLAVHRTLKSLLQHHSSKATIFQCSAFFTVQLSHPYHRMRVIQTLLLFKQPVHLFVFI